MKYLLAPGPHHGFSGIPGPDTKYIYQNPGTGHWKLVWFTMPDHTWKKSTYHGHWFTTDEIKQHHSNLRPIDDIELFTILL